MGFRDITPRIEKQMETKTENFLETVFCIGAILLKLVSGERKSGSKDEEVYYRIAMEIMQGRLLQGP